MTLRTHGHSYLRLLVHPVSWVEHTDPSVGLPWIAGNQEVDFANKENVCETTSSLRGSPRWHEDARHRTGHVHRKISFIRPTAKLTSISCVKPLPKILASQGNDITQPLTGKVSFLSFPPKFFLISCDFTINARVRSRKVSAARARGSEVSERDFPEAMLVLSFREASRPVAPRARSASLSLPSTTGRGAGGAGRARRYRRWLPPH